MSEIPISRETHDSAALNALLPIEPSVDKKGATYLYADDAATANAHYAAEEGKWEKSAQPGFEESAKGITREAQEETAEEDAMWAEINGTKEQDDAALQAEDDYWARVDADEQREEHEASLRDDDEENETDGDLEARGGVSNQDSIAASYYSDDELAEMDIRESLDDGFDDDEDTEDPLAGGVDHSVHPDETADPGTAWGNHAHAARQHGDLTEQ